jgi:hypothetical protein
MIRSATTPLPSRWTQSDEAGLLAHAITLAGLHEATYLALALEAA